MDFGGGFAVGFGAGIGAGMAIGVSNGKKQALEAVRAVVEQEQIEMLDRFGKPIDPERLYSLGGSSTCCDQSKSTRQVLWGLAVMGILMLAAVLLFLLLR